ncbi:DUF7344 domain-containing protein [Haloprofundus halobius]|uniref:DUF7344 domain-containing protein n=1 Tax=Haloprofundus halobius TaxID=2876194 RepID=UPI003CCD264B
MLVETLDNCLQLIADRCQRRVIQQLRHETTSKMTIDDLVDRIYSGELKLDGNRGMDREQLAIHLYHTSLPKLEDHGVVKHDRRSGTVRYQSNDQVEAVLDSLPDEMAVSSL